jgi:DNA polymerase
MFIGEAPGADEDREGLPFVGRSGELLTEALEAAGLTEEQVYITNTVKCRPPGNRNPTRSEMDACLRFLASQIGQPRPVIVILGKVAAEYLLQRPVKITKENGHIEVLEDGTLVVLVYHPAYVLRNRKPEIRREFFQAVRDAREIAYGAP